MKKILTFLLLIVIVVSTSWAYRLLKPEWISFREAEQLYEKKEFAKAIPLYKYAIQKGLEKPGAVFHLAESLYITGKLSDALPVYVEYVRENPLHIQAVSTLGDIYLRIGMAGKAIGTYMTILNTNPGDRLSRIILARALTQAKRFDEAASEYRKVLGD